MLVVNSFRKSHYDTLRLQLIDVASPVAIKKTPKIVTINLINFLVVNQSAHYRFILQNAPCRVKRFL